MSKATLIGTQAAIGVLIAIASVVNPTALWLFAIWVPAFAVSLWARNQREALR